MSATLNLTLTNIETSLIELYAYRDEIARDLDITPKEIAETLTLIDQQIDDFVARGLDKADGIAANLGEFGIRAETCKAIAKRELDRAAMWQRNADHLEAATLRALMMRPEGKRRIETASTTLNVAKNPPSVDIVDRGEIPKPYMRRSITLNADLYDRLMGCLMVTKEGAPLFQELQDAKTTDPEPMKDAIKAELKAGVTVPGARLITDRVRLVVE
jgi:hypothetical protein